MRPLSDPLSGKRLYIEHLADRLEHMEGERAAPNAAADRLFARRMKAALAGYPEPLLAAQLGASHPSILQAIEQRRFDVFGLLDGAGAKIVRQTTLTLLGRLRRGSPP